MADGDYRIGLDGQFLFGAAGNPATTEITNVQDVTLDLSAIEADTKTRASRTWATSKVVLLQGSVQFTMLDKEGDIALSALKTAFFSKGKVALWPKDAESGEGLDADYGITGFSRNEQLTEVIAYNVTAKPNNEQREPQWH